MASDDVGEGFGRILDALDHFEREALDELDFIEHALGDDDDVALEKAIARFGSLKRRSERCFREILFITGNVVRAGLPEEAACKLFERMEEERDTVLPALPIRPEDAERFASMRFERTPAYALRTLEGIHEEKRRCWQARSEIARARLSLAGGSKDASELVEPSSGSARPSKVETRCEDDETQLVSVDTDSGATALRPPLTTRQREILKVLREANGPMTKKSVAAALNVSASAVEKDVRALRGRREPLVTTGRDGIALNEAGWRAADDSGTKPPF